MTRPDRLTVWPTDDGEYGIDVRWYGRDCILQAVVVRQLLVEAGYEAQPGNSQDGRIWELKIGPVPTDEVGPLVALLAQDDVNSAERPWPTSRMSTRRS
jgi:hypothetical protein